jgi:adenine deaminase
VDDNGSVRGNRVDLAGRRVHLAELSWERGRITGLSDLGPPDPALGYLIPGFVDAHVHIESTLLTPAEFGRIAARHGTVASVSDPHEIANVLGPEGVRFMLQDARESGFRVFFGAPACVPATDFETAGGELGADQVAELLDHPEIGYLAEMMNIPGVLNGDPQVLAKLALARDRSLPVDGHAPGLTGADLARYVAAGITTDHECTRLDEAREKLALGMHILIREGSAARNFDTLEPLIHSHPGQVMFCSDDLHPDDLVLGHIDRLAARAVAAGHDPFTVLGCACLNPLEHYHLPLGRLRPGDAMDAAEVTDLRAFRPRRTWIGGVLAAADGVSCLPRRIPPRVNHFQARPVTPADLRLPPGRGPVRVIGVQDGNLLTRSLTLDPPRRDGRPVADPDRDLLYLAVLNRYRPAPPALALVSGFGLRRGALASSVAHDSHNLVAVGADPATLAAVLNRLVEHQGGLAVADEPGVRCLPLPVAGLMSDADGDTVAAAYTDLNRAAAALGSPLRAPFMTLSFMALLVIPELKLSDRGLFDGVRFAFTPVQMSTL